MVRYPLVCMVFWTQDGGRISERLEDVLLVDVLDLKFVVYDEKVKV